METPIGYVPAPGALHLDGLDMRARRADAALHVDRGSGGRRSTTSSEFYDQFGERMPPAIWKSHAETLRRLGA